MASTFEKDHIVDFAEEALLQLNIDLDNSQIVNITNPLLKLITTTTQWDHDKYMEAEKLITLLNPYRDSGIKYFDPNK